MYVPRKEGGFSASGNMVGPSNLVLGTVILWDDEVLLLKEEILKSKATAKTHLECKAFCKKNVPLAQSYSLSHDWNGPDEHLCECFRMRVGKRIVNRMQANGYPTIYILKRPREASQANQTFINGFFGSLRKN